MIGKLGLLLLVSLGVGAGAPLAAQTAPSNSGSSATNESAAHSSYHLGVDDRVRVNVYGEDALSNEYPVGPSGVLSFPLIGDVPAVGRTIDEVGADIRQKLADGYLKDPNVSLTITSFRPFNILGEVNKPGSYPYRDGLTVIGAVATAEGFTYRAQKKYVFIKHEGQGEEVKTPMSSSLAVAPGDTVRVGERYF